jgi:hypothetical protein
LRHRKKHQPIPVAIGAPFGGHNCHRNGCSADRDHPPSGLRPDQRQKNYP